MKTKVAGKQLGTQIKSFINPKINIVTILLI